MEISDLRRMVEKLRAEIGHEKVDVKIREAFFDKEKNEIMIIAPDRPDKSVIIGKGGWVAGKLKEALQIDRVHVEAYTDILIKKYRMKLALDKIEALMEDGKAVDQLKAIRRLLVERIDKIPCFDFMDYKLNGSNARVMVALSGGVDSSFSTIIAKNLGFRVLAVTVDPGGVILPRHLKEGIDRLCRRLEIEHEYLKIDFSDFVKEALEGRFHPCGRCSKRIHKTLLDHAKKNDIEVLITGDLLPTSSQAINILGDVIQISLPALFAASKQETTRLASPFGVKGSRRFGCPLLVEVHRRFPHLRRYSIQRILRELRAGVLEPGEALPLIWGLFE